MAEKQRGPRCVGGSGGPGGDNEDGRKASSPQKIARPARKRPGHSRKVWWLSKSELRASAVDRRWPDAKILFGDGDWAVVSHCRRVGLGRINPDIKVRVSLHRTKAKAEACMAQLDLTGCDPTHFRCDGEHEIADLRTGYDELYEYLHALRAAWRDV